MTPAEILIIANGLLDLYLKLKPSLEKAFSGNQITVEEQAALLAKIDAIRSGAAFQGSEWQIAPDPSPAPKVGSD